MITLADSSINHTPDPHPLFTPTETPLPESDLPMVFYDEEPGLVDLWQQAWKIAWKHVYQSSEMPCSPYLGEGCGTNKIWIWDSCFMSLWGVYAYNIFPVANTLDNFYALFEGEKSSIVVHHPDNPPLFGWAERELYRHSGDRKRVNRIIERKVLQNFYDWRENIAAPGDFLSWSGTHPVMLRHLPNGYLWGACPSGMDNTPRGKGDYQYLLWLDALAQQGMFARDIAALCRIAGKEDEARRFDEQYSQKCRIMQQYYDEEDGCFYDRTLSRTGFGTFVKVLTPASFWPIFAGMATDKQIHAMTQTLLSPEKLGGPVACPSVSRDDDCFDPAGGYWRGGVWLPVFYMTMKALDATGQNVLARQLSLQLLHWMKQCYDDVSPHSIWECYSPTTPLPATTKNGLFCRKDFCGWSALGPISLFLENILGLQAVDAENMQVIWNPPKTDGKNGIARLRLGDNVISLIAEGDEFVVETARTLCLILLGKTYVVTPGTTHMKG